MDFRWEQYAPGKPRLVVVENTARPLQRRRGRADPDDVPVPAVEPPPGPGPGVPEAPPPPPPPPGPGADDLPDAPPELGCPKCRLSVGGCVQCRDPAYRVAGKPGGWQQRLLLKRRLLVGTSTVLLLAMLRDVAEDAVLL